MQNYKETNKEKLNMKLISSSNIIENGYPIAKNATKNKNLAKYKDL
jgi:hypothetical protein